MNKRCNKCKKEFPLTVEYFYKKCKTICKVCYNRRCKEYRDKNKEKINKYQKEYYANNKEYKKKYAADNREDILEKRRQWRSDKADLVANYQREYREKNREIIKDKKREYYNKNKSSIVEKSSKYKKNKYNNDYEYNMKEKIRTAFQASFKNKGLYKFKCLKEYNINIKAIIEKLGDKPDQINKYHIDHIFPISAFDYTDVKQIEACWHPDNLQWLEAKKNIRKSNSYNEEDFKKWLNERIV